MSPFHLPLRRWQLSDEPFFIWQGYRAEMDNPAMLILLPPMLRNRKDVLFGNMPEIYDFHNKYGVAVSVSPDWSLGMLEYPHLTLLTAAFLSLLSSLAEFSCTVWKTAWEHPREWDVVS